MGVCSSKKTADATAPKSTGGKNLLGKGVADAKKISDYAKQLATEDPVNVNKVIGGLSGESRGKLLTEQEGPVQLLVGCYTKGHEALGYYTNTAQDGAYVAELSTQDGKLSLLNGPVAAGQNPTYAAFDADRSTAYFTNEALDKGCVKAFRLTPSNELELLNSKPVPEGNHPCFLAMAGDGSSVLCANYVSGNVTRFPLADDGSLLDGSTTALPKGSSYPGKVASRQDGAHAHCYHPLGSEFGLVCDLGTDQVVAFRIKDGEEVGRCKFPDGSGPRHVAVAADGKWAYASCELGNIVVAFEVDSSTGKLGSEPKCTLSPPDTSGDQNTPSHIDLSSCGRFAFIANRMGVPAADGSCANSTEGSITVVALNPGTENHLTFVETKYLEGKVPRGFCVVGRWLVAGLQESSFIKSFQIGEDGKLTDGHKLEIPSPGVVVAAKRPKLS